MNKFNKEKCISNYYDLERNLKGIKNIKNYQIRIRILPNEHILLIYMNNHKFESFIDTLKIL